MLEVLERTLTECRDCGALPGKYHTLGCDVERCPYCGGQLLMCLMCGCVEAYESPWPPPLDDRMPWTGEWPGERECREFGWYARIVPGKGWVACAPDVPGAREDLNRLLMETEWDRENKRYVRTNLTAAFGEMERRFILFSRAWATTRREGVEELNARAMRCVEHGTPVAGYAFYTWQGKWKKQHGKDFAMYFGQIVDPRKGPIGLAASEVGKVVCDCLAAQNVEHRWAGDPQRPIRIVTASLVTLS